MVFSHLIQLLRPNVPRVCVRCGAKTSLLYVVRAFSFFSTLGHPLGKLNFCFLNVSLTFRLPIGTGRGDPPPSPPACSMGSFSGRGRSVRPLPKQVGAGPCTSETQYETVQHHGDQFALLSDRCFLARCYLFFLPGHSHTHAHIQP